MHLFGIENKSCDADVEKSGRNKLCAFGIKFTGAESSFYCLIRPLSWRSDQILRPHWTNKWALDTKLPNKSWKTETRGPSLFSFLFFFYLFQHLSWDKSPHWHLWTASTKFRKIKTSWGEERRSTLPSLYPSRHGRSVQQRAGSHGDTAQASQ